MKLMCPACNAQFTLDAALQGEPTREAIVHALSLPKPLALQIIKYLACFSPPKRGLSMDRVAAILGELRAAIDAAKITRHGRDWAAPMDYWGIALDDVLKAREAGTLTLPLKSHAYLFQIISALSNRTEALAEQAEHNRRAGITAADTPHASYVAAPPPARVRDVAPMPDHIRAQLKRKPSGGQDG